MLLIKYQKSSCPWIQIQPNISLSKFNQIQHQNQQEYTRQQIHNKLRCNYHFVGSSEVKYRGKVMDLSMVRWVEVVFHLSTCIIWESASKMKQKSYFINLSMSTKLSTLIGNHLLEIEQKDENMFDIVVISIEEKCHKMNATIFIQFGNTHCTLGQFDNRDQFYEFMRHSSNYTINFSQSSLCLRWKMVADGLKKKIEYRIQLQPQELTQKQSLQCEVIVLKRKLADYEKAEQKRTEISSKKAKICKPTNQQDSCQSFSQNEKKGSKIESNFKQRKNRRRVDQVSKNINQLKRKMIKKSMQSKQKMKRKESSQDEKPKQIISLPGDSSNQKQLDPQQKSQSDEGQDQENQQNVEAQQNSREDEKDQPIAENNNKKNENQSIQLKNGHHFKKLNGLAKYDKDEQQNQNEEESKVHQEHRNSLAYKNDEDDQSDEQEGKFYKKLKIGNKTRIDFMNGDYYFGELKNNIFHGNGIYYSKVNGTYEGQWRNGKANGYGVTVDAEGNRHEGLYKNDVRHGKGKDWYPNKERYEGEFCNSNKEGYGVYYYNNGDRYEGNWKRDMCEGFGREIYANGSYYQGQWKEDEKHGDGVLYSSFGEIKQTYNFGKLVSQSGR